MAAETKIHPWSSDCVVRHRVPIDTSMQYSTHMCPYHPLIPPQACGTPPVMTSLPRSITTHDDLERLVAFCRALKNTIIICEGVYEPWRQVGSASYDDFLKAFDPITGLYTISPRWKQTCKVKSLWLRKDDSKYWRHSLNFAFYDRSAPDAALEASKPKVGGCVELKWAIASNEILSVKEVNRIGMAALGRDQEEVEFMISMAINYHQDALVRALRKAKVLKESLLFKYSTGHMPMGLRTMSAKSESQIIDEFDAWVEREGSMLLPKKLILSDDELY